MMEKKQDKLELELESLDQVVGGAFTPGVYRPGRYKKESKAFFRECVGQQTYERAMNSDAGRRHHYVAARAFLPQEEWEKFIWIEQFGSLDGYPE